MVLAHPQGVAATFRVGQHYYSGPLFWTNEDRGLTHALTDTASTDLTVADASPLGAQPQFPTVSCAYRAEGWPQSLTTRSSSMLSSAVSQTQPSAEQERSMCAIWLPRVLVRKHKLLQAAALAPVVETGECEDVGVSVETRARPHSDVHAFGPR